MTGKIVYIPKPCGWNWLRTFEKRPVWMRCGEQGTNTAVSVFLYLSGACNTPRDFLFNAGFGSAHLKWWLRAEALPERPPKRCQCSWSKDRALGSKVQDRVWFLPLWPERGIVLFSLALAKKGQGWNLRHAKITTLSFSYFFLTFLLTVFMLSLYSKQMQRKEYFALL